MSWVTTIPKELLASPLTRYDLWLALPDKRVYKWTNSIQLNFIIYNYCKTLIKKPIDGWTKIWNFEQLVSR